MPFLPMGSVTRNLCTHDPDEASAFMAGHVRPGLVRQVDRGGEIRFSGDYFIDEDFFVGHVGGAGMDFSPMAELDAVLIWCGLKGDVLIEHTGDQARLGPHDILITSARSTKRVVFETPYEGFSVGCCSAAVKREMTSFLGHEVDGQFDFLTRVDGRRREGAGLVALASALQSGLSGDAALLSSPIGLGRLKEAVVSMMMLAAGKEHVTDWASPVSLLSVRELRRADEFMRAHADQPIGIGDVAEHLGVSVRKLQYTFRRHRDTTPLVVLRRYRLEGVKRDLLTSDVSSVAEVALKWGFTNLGRFSRQYRSEFHEKPSQTMARARQWRG